VWGNVVTGKSYQDEWLMEALAHYSALMWIERRGSGIGRCHGRFSARAFNIGADGKSLESAGPSPGAIAWKPRNRPRHSA
jgi:aminopeptidase N